MLRQILFGSLVATLVSIPPAAVAETSAQTVETLMHKSGIWQQLADVAPQVVASMRGSIEKEGSRVTPSEADRVIARAQAAYAVDRLRATVSDHLKRELDPAQVDRLLAWYDGRIGIAITKAEEAGSADVRDPDERVRDDAKLFARLPAARRDMLQRLVEASHGAEVAVTVSIRTAVAARRAVEQARPDAPGVPSNEIEAALERQRPRLESMYGAVIAASGARIYSGVPDESLGKYIDFLASPAGSHFTVVGSRALEAALVAAAEEFTRSLPSTRDQSNT